MEEKRSGGREKILLGLILGLAFLLRFYRIDHVPPSLYWDEASLGYNAYAISQTLRDEHGIFLPHDAFAAFGDYKPVGYVYAAVPFVKILGLTGVAVRLPSVLAGVGLVLLAFLVTRELGRLSFLSNLGKISLMAAFFAAVSSWGIMLSRAAFEANLATFFGGLGIWLFLRAARTSRARLFFFSALFFAAAMYTFNAHRLFVPLMTVALVLIFRRRLLVVWKQGLVFSLTLFACLLPLIPHLLSPAGSLRFREVTWLNDVNIARQANEKIAANNYALWAKIVYNRRVLYAAEFAGHYLDHFRPGFLFTSGDINARLSTRRNGILLLSDAPFLLLALFFLRKKRVVAAVLLSWWLLAVVPAATARETPHALRTFAAFPAPLIVSALGLGLLGSLFQKKILALSLAGLSAGLVFSFLSYYHLVYPREYAGDWQDGYKGAVQAVAARQDLYDFVKVTNKYGRPYIFFLFYGQYPPEKFWQTREASCDRFGFWTVSAFGKYIFDGRPMEGRGLYVLAPGEIINGGRLIETVKDAAGREAFLLYERRD